MPPETDVADVNANSSTEDVVKAAEAASEAKASEESTGDEQDAEGLEGKPEEGVITSFNNLTVFVRYGADKSSKGTDRHDLNWILYP